ncbi:MAG: C25 family cysteine peptidase, partial [Candidatus Cloacimonetes bacterium]|nr:C25 family cysteine peptidase [Candidatus Cloacimonadota bacterium]
MRKHVLIILFVLLATLLMAKQGTIALQSTPNSVVLTRSTEHGLGIRYSVAEIGYQELNTKGGDFTEIFVKHYANTNKTGYPKLPLMRQIISVPLGAEIKTRILFKDEQIVNLATSGIRYPVLPRQESVAKCEDPALVPFEVNQAFYSNSGWTEEHLIQVEELGMMRGVRLVAVDFVPVNYNPATGEIKVSTNVEIEIDFVGGNLEATQALRERTYSQAFEGIYSKTLLNYSQPRLSLNRYPLGYIIVTPQSFVSTLQPFIDWKTREGFNVTVATTEQIGSTTTNIKNYIQNIWDISTTTNPAPSYLLLVGDTPQIPAFTGTTVTGHVTDLGYVRLQGTDFVPEMYYGRFSATSVAELQPQVDKSLMHQQYTMPDDSYLSQVVMIGGVDNYYGNSHANGQINYGTNNYFNATNGITSNTFLYPGSGSSEAAIVSAVSQGRGYVNYTAHGSETSWADPSFTISNINSLQNANKYPIVVGNCCITNHFNTTLCFGEAWLRASNKGAVIYIGGNNNTYWDEDYYWGVGYKPPAVSSGSPFIPNRTGTYDALFHTHDEPLEDWAASVGAMIIMGNLAVAQSNSTRTNYYWEIYSIMGDPSTIPYMGIPDDNPTNYQTTLFLGLNSL